MNSSVPRREIAQRHLTTSFRWACHIFEKVYCHFRTAFGIRYTTVLQSVLRDVMSLADMNIDTVIMILKHTMNWKRRRLGLTPIYFRAPVLMKLVLITRDA